MSKTTLFLKQNLPFASAPLCAELAPERILCNDIIFAGEFNPHNVRLWVVGNEYGAMGAVWAGCEQDAIDELIDSDLADCDHGHGGNAGEAYDTSHLWMAEVVFEAARDLEVMLKFAEARGAAESNLDF